MGTLYKFADFGGTYPGETMVACRTFISATTVPPFTAPRGDIVSGSHVKGFIGRLGNNANTFGTWQIAPGTFVTNFQGVVCPPDGIERIDSQLMVNSGSVNSASYSVPNTEPQGLWSNCSAKVVAWLTTGSNPFSTAGLPATSFMWQTFSGSSGTPVDLPFDCQVNCQVWFTNISMFGQG